MRTKRTTTHPCALPGHAVAGAALALLAATAGSGCGVSDDRAACKRFLGCIAERSPDQLPGLLETYGSGGTCWKEDEIAAGCGDFCRTRMRALALENVSLPARAGSGAGEGELVAEIAIEHRSCVECETDDDCATTGRPGCHVAAGLCVQCTTDEHCQAPPRAPRAGAGTAVDPSPSFGDDDAVSSTESGPTAAAAARCAVDRGVCVECRSDEHCSDPLLPRCNRASGLCGACGADADCPADKPVCVVASGPLGAAGYVVGSAYGYDAAGPNGADGGRSFCSGCRSAADCGGETPLCDAEQGRCVQCRGAGDCSGDKTCNTRTGRCEQSCGAVLSCMQTECAYGCADPNALCGMLQCANAKALAQCVADRCVGCYRDGWYAYSSSTIDCSTCISDWCGELEQRCQLEGC